MSIINVHQQYIYSENAHLVLSFQQSFEELKNIDLFNCEVTNVDGYRDKVFEYLGQLMYLDGFDKNNMEADEDEEEDVEDGEEGSDDEEEDGEEGSEEDDGGY